MQMRLVLGITDSERIGGELERIDDLSGANGVGFARPNQQQLGEENE